MNTMTTAEKAELALRLVREAKILSFDTETSGLDFKRNAPVGWVFHAEGAPSVYIPTRHGGGGNLKGGKPLDSAEGPWEVHPWEVKLAEAFDHRNRVLYEATTVGHNLVFDAKFSMKAGVMLGRNLSCTQNNGALLDEYAKSYSLSSMCETYGVTAKLGEELYAHIAQQFGVANDRSAMGHFWRLPGCDPLAVEYAEGDGVSTLELYMAQLPKMREQELMRVKDIEDRLIWTLARMDSKGIRIDTEYLDKFIAHMEAEAQGARDALPKDFNPRSPKMMRELMEEHGQLDWPKTEKGNPSFTEKWLNTHEIGRTIVNLRQKTNLLNTFAGPLRDTHLFEGRVHATLNQLKSDEHGTISGRLSCSHPNLQAVPKHNRDLAIPLRRAFVPDEGMRLVEADWSQAEPRLFAHYSGSKHLLEGYNATPFRDVHTLVADMMDVDRGTTGKRMNMGIFTGMQIPTFAAHMGMNIKEAGAMWHKWYSLFPEVRQLQNNAKARIQKRGYVHTLLGRRGRLEKRQFAYKATSKLIQGGQADMIKYKMVEIDEMLEASGDKVHLLMQVHDSLLWQAPDTPYGEEVTGEILRIMADVQGEPFNLRVPFVCDNDSGYSWADASFGEAKVAEFFKEAV